MQKKILWLGLSVLILAGCAVSSRYITYTSQKFPPKDPLYVVNVYPASQSIGTANPYYVIGKVSLEGFAGSGVTPEGLANKSRGIARKRGADAVINAKTQVYPYYDGDQLLRFTGDLIVYAPAAAK